MTITQAAAALGLHPDTVRQQVSNGALRAEKLGPIWIIETAEVDRYRSENLGKPGRKKGRSSAVPVGRTPSPGRKKS